MCKMNILLIVGISIGFTIGAIASLVAFVCLFEKMSKEVDHKELRKRGGEVFDYCNRCYEPIFMTEQYIKDDDKNYCLRCGHRRLREGHQFVAIKGDR